MSPEADKSFYEAWLRRTRRQLSASGRLTQIATVLASDLGGTPDQWTARLREILDGSANPSLDLLIRIEGFLSTPRDTTPEPGPSLF